MKWYKTPMGTEEDSDQVAVVIEAKCHDPSTRKLRALEHASVTVSNATAQTLAALRDMLVITMDSEDDKFIHTADLCFLVGAERAAQFDVLLAQPYKELVNRKTGEVTKLWYTNAYRIISCKKLPNGKFLATSRLALGTWKEGIRGKRHMLDLIPVKTGLQRMVAYACEELLENVPRLLREGVCQQVAQDLKSYIGQIESSRVRGEVEYPSTEDRDPERRRRSYEQAIDTLISGLEPIARIKRREAEPSAYAADNPKGDELIIRDDRWDALMRSPIPHAIPVSFNQGDAIRILEGKANFDAGISKRNRHRGSSDVSERVLANRPERIQEAGVSGLRQWYAAIPISCLPDAEPRVAKRALNLNLHLAPIQGGEIYHPRKEEMLLLLSADEDRFFHALRRTDMEIACSRLLKKGNDWYLQLTLRMHPQRSATSECVLGVSFGLDAIATWCVVEEGGQEAAVGALAPNELIAAFIAEKHAMEWDQQKGRWIGGRRFAKRLEQIAHRVANQLIELAAEYHAVLALEEISYVQKCGKDHERNMLFSAWNFGQLPRIAIYKSALAGSETLMVSDYITRLTCPACGALANAKDSPEKAATHRRKEDGVLECRKCGRAELVTPADRAKHAALHGQHILTERKKRSQKKAG